VLRVKHVATNMDHWLYGTNESYMYSNIHLQCSVFCLVLTYDKIKLSPYRARREEISSQRASVTS
jgi:hypothetical protein